VVLGYFTEYKLKNKQLLNEFLTKKEDTEKQGEDAAGRQF
jgi:hypothetical protein